MQNFKRFKFKFLGVCLMETDNLAARDVCVIIRNIGACLVVLALAWHLPELIMAVK